MKNIIITLLTHGYSKTKKYTAKDVGDWFYPMRELVKDAPLVGVSCNDNAFWHPANNKNRIDLYHDIAAVHRWSIRDHAYFRILNRMANGDAYGMETWITAPYRMAQKIMDDGHTAGKPDAEIVGELLEHFTQKQLETWVNTLDFVRPYFEAVC